MSLIEVKQHRRSLGIYGTEVERVEDHDPPAHYFGVPAVAPRTADELAVPSDGC